MGSVTVEMANDYFSNHLANDKWNADEAKKQPALDMSENDIKNYLRVSDIDINNQDVVSAVCEQALCLINNYDAIQSSEVDRIKGVTYRQVDGWGAEAYKGNESGSSTSQTGINICSRALSFISKYKQKQVCVMRG